MALAKAQEDAYYGRNKKAKCKCGQIKKPGHVCKGLSPRLAAANGPVPSSDRPIAASCRSSWDSSCSETDRLDRFPGERSIRPHRRRYSDNASVAPR